MAHIAMRTLGRRSYGVATLRSLASASAPAWRLSTCLRLPLAASCGSLFGSQTLAACSRSISATAFPRGDKAPQLFVQVSRLINGNSFSLYAPLPGGVKELAMTDTDTVNDVIATVKVLDPSVGHVSVQSADGVRLAGHTRVRAFVGGNWTLEVDGLKIGVAATRSDEVPQANNAEVDAALEQLRHSLEAVPGGRTSMEDFTILCQQALVDNMSPAAGGGEGWDIHAVARRWKLLLEEEGLLLHFSHAIDNELRNTIFVKPGLAKGDWEKALDVKGNVLLEELKLKAAEVSVLRHKLEEMAALRAPQEVKARRRVSALTWLTATGMIAQFSGLAYLVYEVSWDVMEPAIYFLDVSYAVLFYIFFLRTTNDPSLDNIFGRMYNWQLKKRLAAVGYDEAEVAEVERQIERRSAEMAVLEHRTVDLPHEEAEKRGKLSRRRK